MRSAALASVLLLAALALPAGVGPSAAAPAKKKAEGLRPGAAGGPTDFSGIWELDEKSSSLPTRHLQNSVLEVTQRGARIWIQPVGKTRDHVLAEEVVVDGRAYEKSLGNKEKGILTARWGEDGKSVWLEVVAGTDENPRAGVQRSVWRLSQDRSTWVRETVTTKNGSAQRSRAVFRRQDPGKREPTPVAAPRSHR
jgi:hypothetical protein